MQVIDEVRLLVIGLLTGAPVMKVNRTFDSHLVRSFLHIGQSPRATHESQTDCAHNYHEP